MADRGPLDTRLDRRAFLGRMAAATAAVTVGGGAAGATPLGGQQRPVAGAAAGKPPGSTGPADLRRPFSGPVALPDPASLAFQDPSELTLAEAASLIRAGRLAPAELLEAYLARIAAMDGRLRAFNTVTAARARASAAALARAPWRGPLHGIPLAIKDNYYTAGVPTTANSLIFADFVPDFDATAWARLEAAGAILLGKTQMGPLATTAASTPLGDPTTVNAWAPEDPDVSPGGSSSGSATAVAARMAASGTGTQTGGSITSPSNAQGLTGIKPTMGRVSLHGIIPLTYTRDHPGPLARDAMDAALMLQVMAGPDPRDPRTLGLPPVSDYAAAAEPFRRNGIPALRWPTTIGVPPGYLEEPQPADVPPPDQEERSPEERRRRAERRKRELERRVAEVAIRRDMLEAFERLGARVVEVRLPEEWDTLTGRDFNNVRLPERTEPFLEHLQRDVRLFGVSLSPWINGLLMPGPEYLRGQRAKLLLLRRVLDGLFDQCDVVVQTTPIPFDIIGLPLVAFPNGMVDGLPAGAMLGGQPYAEDRLLSLVAGYQQLTDWHRRRPADPPARTGAVPRRPRIAVWEVMQTGE